MTESGDLVAHVRTLWFAPVIDLIEEFENNAQLYAEIASIAEPHSAEWAVQCVIKTLKPFGVLTGMPFDGQFESRHVGALIGAKSSICTAMAESHRISQHLKPEVWQKLVEMCGEDAVKQAKATWERFAKSLTPKFEEIRRFGVEMAMRQTYQDDIDFHGGLAKGLTFMRVLRESVRKAATKAQRHAQNRAAVYMFAATEWETIDANREELSWPDLNKAFNEAFSYQVPIDEDAFKKILQRCGLRIGKPGRRVEVRI